MLGLAHECCFHLSHFRSTLKWGNYFVGALRLQSIMADKTWWKHLSVVASGQMELLDYIYLMGGGGEMGQEVEPQDLPFGDPLLQARLYFTKITKPSQTALPTWGPSIKTH